MKGDGCVNWRKAQELRRNCRYFLKAELTRCADELGMKMKEGKDESKHFKPDNSLLCVTIQAL